MKNTTTILKNVAVRTDMMVVDPADYPWSN
jgi:hypothetical protein